MNDQPLIFLSYASPDLDRVLPFYDKLKSSGLNVWMDKYNLKAGQKWDSEIKSALKSAFLIIIFVSDTSVNKRGYVQRELRVALDYAEEKLETDIYVIPVVIGEGVCLPDKLRHLHAVIGSFDDQCEQLLDAIREQFNVAGIAPSISGSEEGIYFKTIEYSESWEGLPGYQVKFDRLGFMSDKFKNIGEVNDIVNGWLAASLHEERRAKFSQDPSHFHFGQNSVVRTNTWEAACSSVNVTGTTLSIAYSIYWYGSGAAHPNQGFRTFSFSLDPLIYIENLSEIFSDEGEGLAAIQKSARKQLLDSTQGGLSDRRVQEGTDGWECFRAFLFKADGIEVLFAPYQVGPFAAGSFSVTVPYEEIVELMDLNFQHLLGIAYRRLKVDEIAFAD